MPAGNPLRIPCSARRTATVIFLHGLGQTNVAWHGMIQWMAVQLPSIEWVLPQAPTRPVSLNAGQQRSSWFDIRSFPPDCNEWEEAAMASSILMWKADPRRIILMGFSQGAALGLLEAMAFLRDVLRLPTAFLTFKRYEGLGHTINRAEMHDVVTWLQSVLHCGRLPEGCQASAIRSAVSCLVGRSASGWIPLCQGHNKPTQSWIVTCNLARTEVMIITIAVTKEKAGKTDAVWLGGVVS
ncbi:Phospholipase/Carboxylesterase-domain-containing protein [Russula vinacea]|nr:Phospholipase/Carboxylesterase-domain-containing protein [Russula vinacea]